MPRPGRFLGLTKINCADPTDVETVLDDFNSCAISDAQLMSSVTSVCRVVCNAKSTKVITFREFLKLRVTYSTTPYFCHAHSVE